MNTAIHILLGFWSTLSNQPNYDSNVIDIATKLNQENYKAYLEWIVSSRDLS